MGLGATATAKAKAGGSTSESDSQRASVHAGVHGTETPRERLLALLRGGAPSTTVTAVDGSAATRPQRRGTTVCQPRTDSGRPQQARNGGAVIGTRAARATAPLRLSAAPLAAKDGNGDWDEGEDEGEDGDVELQWRVPAPRTETAGWLRLAG